MQDLFSIQHSYLIPLLPLAGAVIAGFFCTGARKKFAHWPIWIGVGTSAVLSILLLVGMITGAHEAPRTIGITKVFYNWIQAVDFDVRAGFFFDPLTAVMLCVVCGIGFLITVYAAGYMKGEDGYSRFFAYLGLFIFMMTILVMGENLVMLYLGWEGVGLCSYLLVGYYYEKPSAREAAKKAFLVNRVGDFGFALGIMLSFMAFGTISYFGDAPGSNRGLLELATLPQTAFQEAALQWIPFLLMLGAIGKSAQFPLYVWLPDAMEGPTPVSALIHAATMVTAGIYMIARCGTLFVANEAAMITVAAVGGFTALFAATIALRQFDLKRVFAYSTVSQLGYMFAGVGVLAPVAGVFHLVTHAFFKALLFLASGVVMHAMLGELDMRKMSGLKRYLPKTRWLMLIGCLALSGMPFFSGFFSKDQIIGNAWEHSRILGGVLLLAAFLTAYYTFRVYFRVFEGPEVLPAGVAHGHAAHGAPDAHDSDEQDLRVDDIQHPPPPEPAHALHDEHHNHEPALMIWPLVILAIGAIFAGYINFPGHQLGEFLGRSPSFQFAYAQAGKAPDYKAAHDPIVNPEPFGQYAEVEALAEASTELREHFHASHALHRNMMIISGLIAIAGIYCAYVVHLKTRAEAKRLAARFPTLVTLLEHKYWVDEIYQQGIVEPLRSLGKAFFWIDRWIIDGAVWTAGFVPVLSGFVLKLTSQRGYLQGYALSMLLGITIILLIVFL